MENTLWNKIRVWFHDSETIAWARIQVFVGVLWEVLIFTDLSPIIPESKLPYYIMISGILTETIRRSREPHDLGVKTLADLSTVMLPIKKDDTVKVNEVTGTVTVEKAADIPADIKTKAEEQK